MLETELSGLLHNLPFGTVLYYVEYIAVQDSNKHREHEENTNSDLPRLAKIGSLNWRINLTRIHGMNKRFRINI